MSEFFSWLNPVMTFITSAWVLVLSVALISGISWFIWSFTPTVKLRTVLIFPIGYLIAGGLLFTIYHSSDTEYVHPSAWIFIILALCMGLTWFLLCAICGGKKHAAFAH